MTDPLVEAGLRRVMAATAPSAPIFDYTAAAFVEHLRALVAEIGMSATAISGYSLRRGGATWFLLSSGSMARTSVHGRWASERTARIYIDSAMAQQTRLQLAPPAQRVISVGVRVARALLEQELARAGPAASRWRT